ncbi:MAG TPA: dipeptide ABC transporter ATP-binding protein [Firmicutes bacterium]|nr:dipeptide ABC transporter ATP-binding protein [Bacillota bacterium]
MASNQITNKDPQEQIILEVKDLQKYYPIQRGVFRSTVGHIRAVDGVSFSVRAGETLGLVGESGCGKTTTGRCIIHLEKPTGGEMFFYKDGVKTAITQKTIRNLRRDLQFIFQDPYSSLNPRMTVEQIVAEPLITHGLKNKTELRDRVVELLTAVGLSGDHLRRYPHEFSGGQRQRVGIARALALKPQLVICDEPVSALDVSVQAQVINLLQDLQEQYGLTYLFIAHDLSVVYHICNRIAVMYLGRIVELAEVDELFANPRHPYTEALFSAIPLPDPDNQLEQIILEGDVPSPADPPSGCRFHPRCRYAQPICSQEQPELQALAGSENHLVACHFGEKLSLRGLKIA